MTLIFGQMIYCCTEKPYHKTKNEPWPIFADDTADIAIMNTVSDPTGKKN